MSTRVSCTLLPSSGSSASALLFLSGGKASTLHVLQRRKDAAGLVAQLRSALWRHAGAPLTGAALLTSPLEVSVEEKSEAMAPVLYKHGLNDTPR
mmetsp:Transcript_16968/g.47376  ORF Transcript_16968/g.47376 Transcript_16968/m.47376 type:complete len:95 (-) Transcript_16968:79-363(-)